VSGGVLGLTVLVKSTPMLFPLVLFGYLIVAHRDRSQNLSICLNIAAMVLTMLAVLSPWIIRNYRLTGKFVPTASVLGISAHAGQYICSHLSGDARWFVLDREAATERRELAKGLGYPFKEVPGGYYQLFYSSNHELEFSSYLLKRVVHEYQESPGLFARCTASNLLNIWFAGKTWRSTGINVIVQLPFLVLAVIGAVLTARDGRSAVIAPLVLFLVYYVAVYAPILAQARYSVPVIPFISVLAGRALVAAHRRGVVDRAALA
jgi:hypothetical protein